MSLPGRVVARACLTRSLRALITAHLGADPVVADVPFPDGLRGWADPAQSYPALIGSGPPALSDALQLKNAVNLLLDRAASAPGGQFGAAAGGLILALGANELENFGDLLRTAVRRPLSYSRHPVGTGIRATDGRMNAEVILARSAPMMDTLPWERTPPAPGFTFDMYRDTGIAFVQCAMPSVLTRWADQPTWPEAPPSTPGDPFTNLAIAGVRRRAITVRMNMLWLSLQPGLLVLRQLIRFAMEDEFVQRLRIAYGAPVIDGIIDGVLKPMLELRVHPWIAEVERLHGWRSVPSQWGERPGRRLTTRFWQEITSKPALGSAVDLLHTVRQLAYTEGCPILHAARLLLEMSKASWIDTALADGARVFGWVSGKEAGAGTWTGALSAQADWIITDGRYTAESPPASVPELFWRPVSRNLIHHVRRTEYWYEPSTVTTEELALLPAEGRRPYPPDFETTLRVPCSLPEVARGLTGIPSVAETLRVIATASELQGDVDLEPFTLTFARLDMITGIPATQLRTAWMNAGGTDTLTLELRRLIPPLADGSPNETTAGFKSSRTRLSGFDLPHSALADVPWSTFLLTDGALLSEAARVDSGEGHPDLARLATPLDAVWAASAKIGL